ncbi:hypothetical protein KAK07_16900 [Ideonella sp. 4Y16]|uniref:Uncharacterized protein n=1 Tax=Ideonella alba TaxID=2824118 RepID=A0A940YF46_9BURK|nr:hypothetical protein [Ideonella alba]MBQ0931392.1 hypothetical protein [Ideonella alba]MBQ0945020.1 hypothetical protein [Ideonella alba]
MDTTTLPDTGSDAAIVATALAGLPGDRLARLAARRAFVDLKTMFMRAVEPLQDRKGQWLQEKVRLATDPMDLWLLRGPVLAAQSGNSADALALRAELYRAIDGVFPQAFGSSHLMPGVPPAGVPMPSLDAARNTRQMPLR